jgi:acyl-CoA thioesterase I
MHNQMIENLVQFTHLEKLYGYLPGMDEETVAALFGLDLAAYREIKERFDANARGAARELLEDPPFAGRVDRLPFGAGETVIGVGDSLTDDLQSWLEIVRHLLEERRPQDGIRVVNMGLSAHTTAMVLRRFVPNVVAQEPDWIVCLLGGNDVTRIGPEPDKPQVSLEETAKNLEAMRRVARTQTEARWVWITPPTFDEERAAAYPPFQLGQSRWRNGDVVAIAEFVREQEEPVVDIQAVFGTPADSGLQGPDGVHPSLVGQKAISRAFVERLAPSPRPTRRRDTGGR